MKIKRYLRNAFLRYLLLGSYTLITPVTPLGGAISTMQPGTVRLETVITTPRGGKIIEGFSITPNDSIEQIVTTVQDSWAKWSRGQADADLLNNFGSTAFGRDPRKWVLMYEGKPFDSLRREDVIGDTEQKMRELYRNGPIAMVYQETPVDTIKFLQNFIMQNQNNIKLAQAKIMTLSK